MRTIRARLTVAVLAVVTVGLLALAGITYAEQRSFLMSRLDDQTRAAVGAVDADHDGPDEFHGRGGHGGLDPGGVTLPLGTYGQRRDSTGHVLSEAFLGDDIVDTSSLKAPDLPADLPVGTLSTVSSGGVSYRVYAEAAPDGDVAVVAVPLHNVEDNLQRLLLVEAVVVAAVLLVLAAVAWFIVRLGLRPLERIGMSARRIAAGDMSHRAEDADARNEVGRVAQAFNGMLDRLEQAFQRRDQSERRLRHFLADASHELRTPLASIRGYAELYRLGANRSPADMDKAMRRIEDEAARMGGLVEDMLTLAQLDEVADAPHREVDLVVVARDAVDDARAMAPERTISLSGRGEVLVLGDAHQLHQVLANLLRNAVVHTPEGAGIDVSVHAADDRVLLTVRDHGPGLPLDAGPEIFERFWRTEGGRTRGKAGAGLGLAIVHAIVRSHAGTVVAENAPDGGACFRVELPGQRTTAENAGPAEHAILS
jgi:two-component system OmpR family sensor kinase